jgi:hypothetical protein
MVCIRSVKPEDVLAVGRETETMMGLLHIMWAYSAAWAGTSVLLPEFTPLDPEEFTMSVMLEGMVADELEAAGHTVLRQQEAEVLVGTEALSQCGLAPLCPIAVLPALPVERALVVSIDRRDGRLLGRGKVYEQGFEEPVAAREVEVVPGAEQGFARQMVQMLESEPTAVVAVVGAAPLVETSSAPSSVTITPPTSVVVQREEAKWEKRVEQRSSQPSGRLPDGVAPRHLKGSEGHFQKSGLDARDWIYRAMPHAGRFTMELRGGMGIGDVDRFADVRVVRRSGAQVDQWFREGPTSAKRVRGSVFIGYAAATWIDFGVLGGVQYSERDVTSGVVREQAEQTGERTTQEVDRETGIQAVLGYVQPRVRTYLVPVGPAKPFVFVGADFRMFDLYKLEQPNGAVYPVPPGGLVPGVALGGGLMIDPGPIVGMFVEGGLTLHQGERSAAITSSDWSHPVRTALPADESTRHVVGGFQFRL